MADDKRQKKRGRNKVFRSCFRSIAADKASSSGIKSDGLNTKNGRLGKPVMTGEELFPDGKLVNGGVADNGGDCGVKRPPHRRRRFSRILKAVLFDSMMMKKKKIHRSSSKSSIASDTSVSSSSSTEKIGKTFEDINACSKECTDLDDSCSHSYVFSSSSRTTLSSASTSSSSSINSNSQWSSDQKPSSNLDSIDNKPVPSNSSISNKSNPINSSSRSCFDQKISSATDTPIISIPKSSSHQKELSRMDSRTSVSSPSDKIKSGSKSGSIRWCFFLLLSLIVLVIWGRIFSILCTSIAFYFVPGPRLERVNSVPTAVEVVDLDSDQYKKKVIMAGLLDRTRNPIR